MNATIVKRCISCNQVHAQIDNYCAICGAELVTEDVDAEQCERVGAEHPTISLLKAVERLDTAFGRRVRR